MAKARQNATPLVSICYALVVFAALNWAVFGTGAIRGSHLGQIAGGWLEADATVMAVPLVAQLPWFALMAGLGIYAVWQCMPTARHTDLHGKLRPWVLALVLLNALWLQLLQRDRMGFSLLFALLKINPSPVCVLDEIDTALDDNNTDKFAEYLSRYSQKMQFIVISHRKPTMAVCDSLYGFAMEEKGVSKLLSVKLNQ